MSPFLLALVPAAALLFYSILLGVACWHGLRREVERWFATYLASMILWSFGALMMYVDRHDAAAWQKVMLAGSMAMPVTFYGFVRGLLVLGWRRRWLWLGLAFYLFLLILNAVGLLSTGVHVTDEGLIGFTLAPAILCFAVYYFLFIGLAVAALTRGWRNAKEYVSRNRIKYVMTGLVIVVVGSLSNLSSTTGAFPLDILGNVINASLLAYVIFRYHLLDISLVLRRGMAYSLPTGVIAVGYLLIIFFGTNFLHLHGTTQVFFVLLVAIVVAVALQPIRDRVQRTVDRLFFREKYDASEMLQRLSRAVASVLDVQQLAGMILGEITTTMHVTKASLLLKEDETGDYLTIASRGLGEQEPVRLRTGNPIANWLTQHAICLSRQALIVEPQFAGLWSEERLGLEQAQIELFVPLLVAEDLVGILMLGPKRSEALYSPDEQLTLLTLANQTAVAVQNAQLYQAALKEKEQTNTILQRAFAGMLVVDRDLRILSSNRSTETITGYAAQELLGKRLPDIFGQELWGAGSALSRSLETGQPTSPVEIRLRGKDETRDVLLGVTPVRDGFLLNFTDITRLKEVDRLKSNIVSNVSHELRTPLASIKAYTELLLDEVEGEDRPLRRHFLSVIDTEADRLAQFINDLLDLSRLQSGRIEDQVEPSSLSTLMEEVAKSLDIQAQRAGVAIRLDLPESLPVIPVNRDLIRSMARNLIGNAIKYSPKGGEVRVAAHAADGAIVLDIIDHGIGIPPEDLPHLFKRFYRAWTAQQSGIRGTGLGLVVSKEAVERHGGAIAVESQVGVGTCFRVTLPIQIKHKIAQGASELGSPKEI